MTSLDNSLKINDTQPLLSVVITQHGPDYDISKYFDINNYSLFSHINEPIEIIITEDYEDKEPEYIANLKDKGLNIIYTFSDKQGLAHNRNNGLFHASGRYVTFVDSPDTLDFTFSDLSELLSMDYDVITYTTEHVYYCIFTIPNIWGKFFKTDLLKKLGGFYFSWTGWWEEGASHVTLSYNAKDYNIKHLVLKSDKIIYTYSSTSPHTSNHFPTKKEIFDFIGRSKSNFYYSKPYIYYEHLRYVESLINTNHDRFDYNYSDILKVCNIEKSLIEDNIIEDNKGII
jgi:glycosyltransferase involved in cell wall biosynthesis